MSINVLDLGAKPTAPYAATVIFSAAFAGSNGTNLRIQVEGSIDNSTWFAIAASPALPISTINRMLQEKHRFNLPIEIPVGSPTPRYYRLSYTVNAGPFTTGAVNSFLHQNRDQPTGYLFPKTNLTGQDGLSGPDGAGMVGFDALTGEYPAATIGSQLRTRMTVDGLKIGVEQDDVVAVENRAKIQEYIDYAGANGGGNIYLPAGIIKVQPGLKLLPSTHVWGQGVDEFERIEHGQFGFERGTTLLLTSSPADTIQIDGITNMSPYGGIVPNPDHRGAGFNDDYSLFDFTNADATATTPATLKNISYGFLLNKAHNAGVHNLRIAPEFNGISGYYDTSLLALGNDVDVGILNLNSKFVYCSDFQCFGNWRVAGLGVFLSNMAPDIDNAITFGLYERAQISGYRCIMVRATDIQRVLAKTANTVTIPWSPSNRYQHTGGYISPSAGTPRTYTGITVAGDQMTFTGVNDTSNFTVGGTAYPASNFGSSWNKFRDIYCLGWDSPNNMPACMLGFPFNSCGLETSGHNLRTTIFENVKVHDRDCFLHAHQSDDIQFIGSNAEAPQTGSTPGASNLPRAARCIIAPGTNGAWFGNYGVGGASVAFDVTSTVSALIDMVPAFNKTAPGVAKYPNTTVANGNGLCRPATIYGFGIQGQVDLGRFDGARNYAWGNRAYTAGTGAANRWGLYDQNDGRLLLEAAPDSDWAFYIADGATSGNLVVGDDQVGTYTPKKAGGILIIMAENSVGLPRPDLGGIIAFATGGTLRITKYDSNTGINVVNTDVNGTTGVDGKTTVGVVAGSVRIENRTGAQLRYRFFLVA